MSVGDAIKEIERANTDLLILGVNEVGNNKDLGESILLIAQRIAEALGGGE